MHQNVKNWSDALAKVKAMPAGDLAQLAMYTWDFQTGIIHKIDKGSNTKYPLQKRLGLFTFFYGEIVNPNQPV